MSAAAGSRILRVVTGGRGHERLSTVIAAKVKRLSVAFGVQSSRFVDGHPADGVFGR
jgi:hypothetical protein